MLAYFLCKQSKVTFIFIYLYISLVKLAVSVLVVCLRFSVSSPGGAARKGRTKKESSDNTNRPNPGGHERKIVEKLQNSEKKAKQ